MKQGPRCLGIGNAAAVPEFHGLGLNVGVKHNRYAKAKSKSASYKTLSAIRTISVARTHPQRLQAQKSGVIGPGTEKAVEMESGAATTH